MGLSELYIGMAVVSRRNARLTLLWVAITLSLNALIVPLSVSGLEAVPVWQILSSRSLRVVWGAGLGLLSTLCVCGCLWADVLREGSEIAETYETHLLSRISQEQAQREAAEAQVIALRAEMERTGSVAPSASAALRAHAACSLCGYWDADQQGSGAYPAMPAAGIALQRSQDAAPR